jgi:hypothetical protein
VDAAPPEPLSVRFWTNRLVTPDTRQIAAHFPEEVAWQLRELAVERRKTVQALMGEALNDLFQKYGRSG